MQIAEEGLANEKNRRVLRVLIARGLVTRERNIRLMNETFRRFVLSDSVREEAVRLEGQAVSPWDNVRMPFLMMLTATMAFFFITQHELFNTALGVLTGVAAGIPVILKVVSLFADKRAAA